MTALEYKGYEIQVATLRVVSEYYFEFDDDGNIDHGSEIHDWRGDEEFWLVTVSKNDDSADLSFYEEPLEKDIREAIDELDKNCLKENAGNNKAVLSTEANKKSSNASRTTLKSLCKQEYIKILKSCVDDHRDNLQYADDVESKWRNECIEVLEHAIKELDKILSENSPITIAIPKERKI